MKKLSILLIAVLLLFACKKDEQPVLTGTWNKYFTFTGSDTFNGTLVIVQNGDKLSGSFVISDNSGYAQLLDSSKTTGSAVIIEWMLSIHKLSFQGTVNATFDSMNGIFYSDGTQMGTWLANKSN